MPIVKLKKHTDPYVIIDKRPLNDKRLSWKAKGLIAHLLTKPDDWQVVLEDLVNRSPDGKTAVRSGLHELRQFGYAEFAATKAGNGLFTGSAWTIYEQPPMEGTEMQVSSMSEQTGAPETLSCGKSATTNKGCTRQNEGTSKRMSNRSRRVEEELMARLRRILSRQEMTKNGGCWRLRARDNPRALANAIEDCALRKDNYHKPLRNVAAWLNKRFKMHEAVIRRSDELSLQVQADPEKLRHLIRESLR